MQGIRIKKITFFAFLMFLETQLAHAQSLSQTLQKADSLFLKQDYPTASVWYDKAFSRLAMVHPALLLKMAYTEEKLSDYPKSLYYLNLYYEQKPDELVVQQMNRIADENGFVGYELNDLNFLVLLYKQYSVYIFALLLVLSVYIFGVLMFKRIKNQFTPLRHKLFLSIYLFSVAVIINLPDSYQSAIVKQDKVFLRNEPSAGASVKYVIDKGHRLSVLGSDDIWLRVLWENELLYVRKQSVWLVQ